MKSLVRGIVRLRSTLFVLLLQTACTAVATPRVGNVSDEAGSPRVSFSSGAASTDAVPEINDSALDAFDTIGSGPKTERALGYVLLVTEVIVLTILLIGFFKLGKILSG